MLRPHHLLDIAAITAAALLSGCGSVPNTSLNNTLDTLAKNYGPCDRTLHYSLQAGPMNAGSGVVVNGDIHCPPHNPDGTPIKAPTIDSLLQAPPVAPASPPQ